MCRKFYALSLAYHPDRNRSDPTASERFATISAAYHVLSNPFQRARYDREHGIHSTAHTNRDMHQRGGSGATGRSYMGSRPASGLSQRRGPFKGPPPSFYAHGGYGAYTARGDQRKGAAGYERRDGDDPTSFVRDNPVSHFNAGAHFRTQAAEDQRRRERKLRAMGIDENSARDAGSVFLARFTIVTGILLGGIFVGSLFREGVMVERRKDQKM
ncbi:hypothetical protein VTN49DRAFT_3015 [Thermomyces lanuginosus]|uniref:uncharacterized protein n=1 Tax=Thermomyces lanuginosus TaxID=5541 RepID=UPI003742FFE7